MVQRLCMVVESEAVVQAVAEPWQEKSHGVVQGSLLSSNCWFHGGVVQKYED